jgi:hypothetical protein
MTVRLFALSAALAVGFATLVAPAPAATTLQEGYDPHVVSQGVGTAHDAGSGTIPFTGLDLGLVLASGVVLLAIGVTMSRLGRRTD